MLNGLTPFLPLPPSQERPLRLQIFTSYVLPLPFLFPLCSPAERFSPPHSSRPESLIAPYLTSLQTRVAALRIRIGSYPVLQQGVYVSLIGRDECKMKEVAAEVEREVGGKFVTEEEVFYRKGRSSPPPLTIMPLRGMEKGLL